MRGCKFSEMLCCHNVGKKVIALRARESLEGAVIRFRDELPRLLTGKDQGNH